MEIKKREDINRIITSNKITGKITSQSESVESNLLFAILKKLEEIHFCIKDIKENIEISQC